MKIQKALISLGTTGLLLGAGGHAACAQVDGVRHRIDAIVSVDPDSFLLTKAQSVQGTLSFSVRISANSMESRYFGVLSPSFSDVLISKDGGVFVAQSKVWEEEKCHQRRGLPKVTVVFVKAGFGQDHDTIDIEAMPRHLGLRVPSDELTPGIKLNSGSDNVGTYYTSRASTRQSRLNVDLKIYSFECHL